jgi:hypothetical protein
MSENDNLGYLVGVSPFKVIPSPLWALKAWERYQLINGALRFNLRFTSTSLHLPLSLPHVRYSHQPTYRNVNVYILVKDSRSSSKPSQGGPMSARVYCHRRPCLLTRPPWVPRTVHTATKVFGAATEGGIWDVTKRGRGRVQILVRQFEVLPLVSDMMLQPKMLAHLRLNPASSVTFSNGVHPPKNLWLNLCM